MTRQEEITQSCVVQILDNWNEWSNSAEESATSAQDSEVWRDEMHANLCHVVKASIDHAWNSGWHEARHGEG